MRPLRGRDSRTKAFDTAQSGVVRNVVISGIGKAYEVPGGPIALEALLDDIVVLEAGRRALLGLSPPTSPSTSAGMLGCRLLTGLSSASRTIPRACDRDRWPASPACGG